MNNILGFPTIGIVGTAEYPNKDIIKATVDLIYKLNSDAIIVSGRGGNVDITAENHAKELQMNTLIWPAQWKRHGNRAGFVRNPLIAGTSAYLLGFWDGVSNGTKSTLKHFHERVQDKSKFCIIPIVELQADRETKLKEWNRIKDFLHKHLLLADEVAN